MRNAARAEGNFRLLLHFGFRHTLPKNCVRVGGPKDYLVKGCPGHYSRPPKVAVSAIFATPSRLWEGAKRNRHEA